MSSNKRYVPIAQFQRISGLSFPTIRNALETGQLKGLKTDCGHWRVDTQADTSPELSAVMNRLQGIETAVKALCTQFREDVGGGDS